ncbi:hypothetical protein TCAL_00537 [Tigriopus californicus]|uniref:Neurotransmitter-gated ion-channel ligand-binding domain-containing protein n=1 Tax=Tigriopus californicus TaxID=6832 RepID=A0A553PAZ5_TIGCA|nr:hypothetical protein TCAL_00537 [Tigriopus californicus]
MPGSGFWPIFCFILLIIRWVSPYETLPHEMITSGASPCSTGNCKSFDEGHTLDYNDELESSYFTHSSTSPGLSLLMDNNYCNPNRSYVWCLPRDYNQEKHPFTYSHLTNKSLPWRYDFKFVVEEISNVNDKAQTMSISMYFGVSWLDPRLQINATAKEWTEVKTGPKNEVNVSPESLRYIWYPELEIYGLERFGRQRVLKEMSGVRIRKNKTIHYELGFEDLPEKDQSVVLPSGTYAACGFQVQLQRKQMQYLIQVYLPSCMFVVVSWVSFLIKPEVVPGRMALLVTLFLVLINIFNSVRERAPISSRLNAVDLYLVVCIFWVFGALMEYAVILLLLKKRRRPKYSIDTGLKNMFHSNNGEMAKCTQASSNELELQSPIIRRPKKVTDHVNPHMHAVCDNIDAWSMWLSPPLFIIFNLAYGFAYQHVDVDPPEPHQFQEDT